MYHARPCVTQHPNSVWQLVCSELMDLIGTRHVTAKFFFKVLCIIHLVLNPSVVLFLLH